jgi:hypothetical protein
VPAHPSGIFLVGGEVENGEIKKVEWRKVYCFEYAAEERRQAVTASLPNFDLCIYRAALWRYFDTMIIDCIVATF